MKLCSHFCNTISFVQLLVTVKCKKKNFAPSKAAEKWQFLLGKYNILLLNLLQALICGLICVTPFNVHIMKTIAVA